MHNLFFYSNVVLWFIGTGDMGMFIFQMMMLVCSLIALPYTKTKAP